MSEPGMVLVTGGTGFLGRAVAARAMATWPGVPVRSVGTRDGDLTRAEAAAALIRSAAEEARRGRDRGAEREEGALLVVHAAGRSGGLGALRADPAGFFRDNLLMGVHVVDAVHRAARGLLVAESAGAGGGVRIALVLVGHMTMYPADAPQPYAESSLHAGPIEPDLAPLGQAKLAVLEHARAVAAARARSGGAGLPLGCAMVIPTNLMGPGDTFDPARSHAMGAMVRRFADAADGVDEHGRSLATAPDRLSNWGSGTPTRDVLFIDDAARGVLAASRMVLERLVVSAASAAADRGAPDSTDRGVPVFNLSGGVEFSIRELAERLARLSGFRGRVEWDTAKPDGVARRALDPRRAARELGWRAEVPLDDALGRTIAAYRSVRPTAGCG